MKDNTCITMDAQRAATVWRVLKGELYGTKAQKAYVKRIRKIYLNQYNAPESYKAQFQQEPVQHKPHPSNAWYRRGQMA